MKNINLKKRIIDLINQNKEGLYWDFKSQVPKNNNDLIYDILCLANCQFNGDRYLIFGVSQIDDNFKVIGFNESQKNQIQSDNLQNKLYTFDFAGGVFPEIETEFIKIDEKMIGVLIIKDSENKPYFLEGMRSDQNSHNPQICILFIH